MSDAIFFTERADGVLPCPKCGGPAHGTIYDEAGMDCSILSVECTKAQCAYSMQLYIPRDMDEPENCMSKWNLMLEILIALWNRMLRRTPK